MHLILSRHIGCLHLIWFLTGLESILRTIIAEQFDYIIEEKNQKRG